MEDEGLIKSSAEKEGNRPERRVYEVTTQGDDYFLNNLREMLATDTTSDQPGISVLEFVDSLAPDVAAEHLAMRRAHVAARHSVLAGLPDDVKAYLPALELKLRITEVELEWLDAKLAELHALLDAESSVNRKLGTG